MPSPNATPTPITPPRVPLIDPRTGLIDRAWYLFFLSLNNIATGIIDEGGLAPSPESLIASYDAALQALAQNVDTQPPPVDLSAELIKQIEAAGLIDCCSGLLSQVAEMQKQLEALNLLPPPPQGTVTAVTATAPVASSGGTEPNISMSAASTSTDGYLTSTDWNTFNSKAPATSGTSILYGNGSGGFSNVTIGTGVSFAGGTLSATGSGGTVTSVTGTAPIASTGGATPDISISQASTSTNGYLSSTDWNTFNNKGSGTVTAVSVVSANGFAGTSSGGATPAITLTTSISGMLYGNGTALAAATISAPLAYSAGTLSITQSGSSTNGYLSSTDWNTFNNKQPAGTYVTSVTGTAPVVSSGGTTPAISMAAANGSTNGYLTSTDWTTFNNKGSGTVTSVAALTLGTTGTDLSSTVANGTTTPVITLNVPTASATNRGALSSTDWSTFNNKQSVSAPVTYTANFSVAATDLWIINNKSGSSCTATLPAAASYAGRVLHFQNYQAQTLVSASSNVVPLAGGAAATSILLASAGDSATLVSDGANWLMTQYVPNNILLLE
jgi:hypothetical protein